MFGIDPASAASSQNMIQIQDPNIPTACRRPCFWTVRERPVPSKKAPDQKCRHQSVRWPAVAHSISGPTIMTASLKLMEIVVPNWNPICVCTCRLPVFGDPNSRAGTSAGAHGHTRNVWVLHFSTSFQEAELSGVVLLQHGIAPTVGGKTAEDSNW